MDKKEMSKLIRLAEQVLNETKEGKFSLFYDMGATKIDNSYNGQIAALSVSILMIDLCPTLSVYYQDNEGTTPRRNVLEIIARMVTKQNDGWNFANANALVRFAFSTNDNKIAVLKNAIIDCAVALKHVVRTYELVTNNGKQE